MIASTKSSYCVAQGTPVELELPNDVANYEWKILNQNHVSEEGIERELEECVIKDRGSYDSGGLYLLFESGWSVQCPEEVYDRALPRTTIHRESYNSSTTGWLIDGEWISRKTDGEILQRKKSLKEAFARMNQDMLDENREYWQQLEDDLPD